MGTKRVHAQHIARATRDIWDVWNRGQNGSRSLKPDFRAWFRGSSGGRFFISIISTVDHAGTRLKNVPTPRFPPTGSAHHALLTSHLTALSNTISQVAWIANGISLGLGAATHDFMCTDDAAADVLREIQRYNDLYNNRYPVRPTT